MIHTLKHRLASSGSWLILIPLVAAGALALGVSAACADTTARPGDQTEAVTATATADATATDTTTDETTGSAATSTEVGELMVTARLRVENVQKVPENIVAIAPQVLQENHITNFFELQGFAPSVDVSTAYIRDYSSILIRGFAAAAYFNEVSTQPYSLYDLSNVQILYGPQGTLFGFTALGGAVLYTPQHPVMNTFETGVDVTLGNLNMTNVRGYVNIPLMQDHLAMRISFERDHTDGFTAVQNSTVKLDSNDNEGLRIGVQWNPGNGRFTNYSLVQWDHQYDTPTARAVVELNPLEQGLQSPGGAFANPAACPTGTSCFTPTGIGEPANLTIAAFEPAGVAFPGSPAGADAYACQPGVLASSWAPGTTAAQCAAQHLAVLNTFTQQANAALALTRATNGRVIPAPIEDAPLVQLADNIQVQDIANYDVVHWGGFLGGGDVYIHNIATYLWYRNFVNNFTVGAFDYYAASGSGDVIPTPTLLLQPGTTTNPNNAFGTPELGSFNDTMTDEFQIHGSIDTSLGATPGFTWVIGFVEFGSQANQNHNQLDTSQNIPISYDGYLNDNEGPYPATAFPEGYWATQFAQYFNGTIDAGMFWKPLKGFHLTGGMRFSENRTSSYTAPVTFNYASTIPAGSIEPASDVNNNFYPTAVRNHTLTRTKPVNWSVSLDYTTADNMVYANASYITVPGFANAVPAVDPSLVPGYVPAAAAEQLTAYEIGDKWNFNFGNVRGYADLDAYYEPFTNVQIADTVFIPSTATYFTYTANPASEVKSGIEFQGEIFPIPNLDIYANFSYAHDYYTQYLESDPAPAPYTIKNFSDAPGAVNSPLCDVAASKATILSGTTGTCIMNFKSNPVGYQPDVQASLRIRYTYSLPNNAGDLVPSITVNYTGMEYFAAGGVRLREAELLGPAVYAATSQPALTLVNVALQWNKPMGHDNLTVSAFVTNLFDVNYAEGGIDTLFAIGVATKDYGPPREFGFELSAKF